MKNLYLFIENFLFFIIFVYSQSASAVIFKPLSEHWLSLDWPLYNLKVSPLKNYLAFTDTEDGMGLKIIDIHKKLVLKISDHYVGNSFYWAPDNCRLFFKEIVIDSRKKFQSKFMSYDCLKDNIVNLRSYPYENGYLVLHPRDLSLYLLHPSGIHVTRLQLPYETTKKTVNNFLNIKRWALSENGVFYIKNNKVFKKLNDDNFKIISFDISTNEQNIVWTSENNKIYYSIDGENKYFLDEGKDPRWHPIQDIVVYVSPRKIGNKIVDYDLKIADLKGNKRYLTKTYGVEERWPNWSIDGKEIIYTQYKSTDLYKLKFKN